MSGISTYPFKVCGGAWGKASLESVSKGNTVIGNDVWIGNSVTIMPGITIGDGAILGANSVVTKDVEPYTIVGGNPTKEIRKRFDVETIDFLCALQWWNWDAAKITQHLDLLTRGDISELRKIYQEKA